MKFYTVKMFLHKFCYLKKFEIESTK